MPIAIDPNTTFWLTLDSDAAKPEAERPSFNFAFLTAREWIALAEVNDSIEDKKVTAAQMVRNLDKMLAAKLKGWRNITPGYSGDNLMDVATPAEIYELADKLMHRTRLDGADLKK